MICPGCGQDVHPAQELMSNMRLVNKCPRCEVIFPGPANEPPQLETKTVEVVPPKPSQSAQVAPQSTDIMSMALSRLATIEDQIKALKALEQEAEMLRRMIAAANSIQN